MRFSWTSLFGRGQPSEMIFFREDYRNFPASPRPEINRVVQSLHAPSQRPHSHQLYSQITQSSLNLRTPN